MSLLALNVCLLPPSAVESVTHGLSTALCQSTANTPYEYFLANGSNSNCANHLDAQSSGCPRGRGFAHVTLTQLFVREADVENVVEAARQALSSVPRNGCVVDLLPQLDPGPVFAEHEGTGIHLPSVVIATNVTADEEAASFVSRLHQQVAAATRTLRQPSHDGSSAFAKDWPGNDASCAWVTHYDANSSNLKYYPHITLGACSHSSLAMLRSAEDLVPPDIRTTLATDWTVAVCRMGNFCSCNTVLAVVEA